MDSIYGMEHLPMLVGKRCCVVVSAQYNFWQHGSKTDTVVAIGIVSIAHGRVYVQRSPLALDCAIEAIEVITEEAE